MTTYITQQHDRLDLICWRHYKTLNKTVEAVLAANPGLADYRPVLPMGLTITLPTITTTPRVKRRVKLWE